MAERKPKPQQREKARKCDGLDCSKVATIWTKQGGWRCDEHKDSTLEQFREYAVNYPREVRG